MACLNFFLLDDLTALKYDKIIRPKIIFNNNKNNNKQYCAVTLIIKDQVEGKGHDVL